MPDSEKLCAVTIPLAFAIFVCVAGSCQTVAYRERARIAIECVKHHDARDCERF